MIRKTALTFSVCMAFIIFCLIFCKGENTEAQAREKLFSPLNYINGNNKITENEKSNIELTEIDTDGTVISPLSGNPTSVLVYHTHTTEAYLENAENRGEILASRSENYYLTVNYIGEMLCSELVSYGMDAQHDKTNNETEGYSNAYLKSKQEINKMTDENGEYDIYIDVHRDSFSRYSDATVEIDGESVARIMLVVGGSSPHSQANSLLAQKVKSKLDSICNGLCEKVLYSESSNYNQISDGSLLIEIGDNGVSVEEAARAAAYVAKALGMVINSENEQ